MKYIKAFEKSILKYNQLELNRELIYYSQRMTSLQGMKDLIKLGANVNFHDNRGNTPLMKSSEAVFEKGVRLLIENNAEINAVNHRNYSAFSIIVSVSNYQFKVHKAPKNIIDLLITNGANMNIYPYDRNGNFIDPLDNILNIEIKKYIKNKFPNQYKEYLIKKEIEKYNL